jgi:hypothetical protein
MCARAIKVFLFVLAIETFVLYLVLSRTPEVTLKATDHISCGEQGYEDHGPVDVQFQIGTVDKRILVIKTKADSWKQAEAICNSWNDIGAALMEK